MKKFLVGLLFMLSLICIASANDPVDAAKKVGSHMNALFLKQFSGGGVYDAAFAKISNEEYKTQIDQANMPNSWKQCMLESKNQIIVGSAAMQFATSLSTLPSNVEIINNTERSSVDDIIIIQNHLKTLLTQTSSMLAISEETQKNISLSCY